MVGGFIIAELAGGASAAEAHRSLAERMARGTVRLANVKTRPRVLILVAERDHTARS